MIVEHKYFVQNDIKVKEKDNQGDKDVAQPIVHFYTDIFDKENLFRRYKEMVEYEHH